MSYTNNNGQVRVGVRSGITNSPIIQPAFSASLLQSLYGVWNGDTTTNELSTSIFGVWNGESSNNVSVKNAWNANGNAIDSKSAANGTVAIPSGTTFTTGTMTYSTGKLGSGSFTFDGTNFINLPNNTLNFTGDFTVSCWFYTPANYVANGSLVSAFDNKSSYPTYYGWNFSYDSTNKCIGFSIGNPFGGSYANVALSTPNNSIVAGQWNHVAITRKFNTRSRIYINGVLSTSNTSTLNPIYNYGLAYIGAIFYGFQQPHYNKPNAGLKIDSIYTFESELDATAVSELYNSGNGQEYPFTISNALIASPKDVFGTNHGTLMNGCTFTTGKVGNAFSFDGVNDYLKLPNNSLNFIDDFSVSFWMKLSSLNQTSYIIDSAGFSGIGTTGWVLNLTSGNLNFTIHNNNNASSIAANYVLTSTSVWYHVVITSKSGYNAIYINNSLVMSNTSTMRPNYVSSSYNIPYIGVFKTANTQFFYGNIDSLTTWNKAISQDEVTQLYNLGTGTQYPFSGQTLPSTNNQLGVDNGSLMNGASLSTGKIGQAFTFDGVNDYVSLPNNSLNLTTFSISAWVNPSNTVGSRTILNSANYVSALDYGWKFRIIDGQLSLQIFSTGGLINEYKGGGISTNTWTHVSATRINGSTKLYINGSLVGSQTSGSINNNPNFTTTTYCSIGSLTSAVSPISFFIGSIDSINVWQKELTQSEITELYNSGNGKQITTTPIVQNGLVLNLDASRSSSYPNAGTTWVDISGSGNNGTLVNGPIFGTANGGGITFDGVNDRITLQNTNISATGNWTISTWFNLSALNLDLVNGAPAVLYSQYAPTPGNGRFLLMVRNDGIITNKFQLFLGSGTGYSNQPITGTTTVQINTTYNLVAIRNGSVFSLYLNGNLEASLDLTGTNISLLQNTSEIGGVSNGNFGWVNGKIYNPMVYNRALSPTEITQNFNSTKSRFGL